MLFTRDEEGVKIQHVQFSPENGHLVAAKDDGGFLLLRCMDWQQVRLPVLGSHKREEWRTFSGGRIAFSPDGKSVASAYMLMARRKRKQPFREVVSVWDCDGGSLRLQHTLGEYQSVRPYRRPLAFHPSDPVLAVGCAGGRVAWFELRCEN
jgi:hypothetical protein